MSDKHKQSILVYTDGGNYTSPEDISYQDMPYQEYIVMKHGIGAASKRSAFKGIERSKIREEEVLAADMGVRMSWDFDARFKAGIFPRLEDYQAEEERSNRSFEHT